MSTTVRAGGVAGLLEFVAAKGGVPERVLERAGLEAAQLADPERQVAIARLAALFAAAAEELGDDDFGFHFALAHRSAMPLGVVGYAIRHAPTVAAAMRNFERYISFAMRRGKLRVSTHGPRAHLTFETSLSDFEAARHYTEASAVVLLRAMRAMCGKSWRAKQVLFGHRQPANLGERTRFFGAPLQFGQPVRFRLVFAASDLHRRVAGADSALLRVVERHLETHLAGDDQDAWIEDARRAIGDALSSGDASVRAVAKRLGVSARTLQRRLEAKDVSFQTLISDVRRELAEQFLSRPDLSLMEVAFLLGYSDLSSFHRAFRRWSGRTPLERRKSLITPPPPA